MIKMIIGSHIYPFQMSRTGFLKSAVLAMLLISMLLAGCTATPDVETLPAPAENLPAGTWKEISIEEAATRYDAGAFMLDVRQPDEWEEMHIPGATLIPLGELNQRLGELPKDQEIVVYCRSGNRSQSGAEILSKNGFNGVSSMAGGITQWSAAGYPTESGK